MSHRQEDQAFQAMRPSLKETKSKTKKQNKTTTRKGRKEGRKKGKKESQAGRPSSSLCWEKETWGLYAVLGSQLHSILVGKGCRKASLVSKNQQQQLFCQPMTKGWDEP